MVNVLITAVAWQYLLASASKEVGNSLCEHDLAGTPGARHFCSGQGGQSCEKSR